MSYNKTIWRPGDIITSEKWNKIVNNTSIELARKLPVNFPNNPGNPITISISSPNLINLFTKGITCWFFDDSFIYYLNSYDIIDGHYIFDFKYDDNNSITFYEDLENNYITTEDPYVGFIE